MTVFHLGKKELGAHARERIFVRVLHCDFHFEIRLKKVAKNTVAERTETFMQIGYLFSY